MCIRDRIREHNSKATIITTPLEQLNGKDILETIEGAADLEKELMEEVLEAVSYTHLAREHVEEYGLAAYIDVRLSDGLSGLPCRGGRPEADTLLAAGMGGRLTVKILEEGAEKLAGMRWVILQPQSEPWLVRKSLRNLGYFITDENMIWEEGKYYAVMKAVNLRNLPEGFPVGRLEEEARSFFRNRPVFSETEWEQAGDRYGSWLLIRRNPVLFSYLEDCLDKTAGILKGIDGQKDDAGYSDKTGKRLAQLKEEQRLLEQLLMLYKEKSL